MKLPLVLCIFSFSLLTISCSSDDQKEVIKVAENPTPTPVLTPDPIPLPTTTQCEGAQIATFAEKDGLLVIEAESNKIPTGWKLETTIKDFTGSGYIVGQQDSFNIPGIGLLSYKINITNAGTYRFIWKSRITSGDSNTDFNDSFLRISDAADFYAQKGTNIVYPKGTGKTPNPDGTSADGWFKIYMNTVGKWHWQASTFDHDPYKIYATFNTPGVYTVEISVRSKGHGIDKFVLFKEDMIIEKNATTDTTAQSSFTCE